MQNTCCSSYDSACMVGYLTILNCILYQLINKCNKLWMRSKFTWNVLSVFHLLYHS